MVGVNLKMQYPKDNFSHSIKTNHPVQFGKNHTARDKNSY